MSPNNPWQRIADDPRLTESMRSSTGILTEALAAAIPSDIADILSDVHLRTVEGDLDAAASRLAACSDGELGAVLRADTALFHLLNQAEKSEIVKINRDRSRRAGLDVGRPESITHTFGQMRHISADALRGRLEQLDVQPTMTAHPTEARRRSILYKQQALGQALRKLDDADATPAEKDDARRDILRHIQLLQLTDEVRSQRLTVEDEAEYGLYFLRNTIWETIPRILDDLRRAAHLHFGVDDVPGRPLRFRSWIGSDRDGNPFVTPDVTRRTFNRQRTAALERYLADLRDVRRALSVSDRQHAVPASFIAHVAARLESLGLDDGRLEPFAREPFRLHLTCMMEQIAAVLRDLRDSSSVAIPGYTATDFRSDLERITDALRAMNLPSLAETGPLRALLDRAAAFGFHLAALDVRQHSQVHEEAITDLLRVAGVHDAYDSLTEPERLQLLSTELGQNRPLLPRGMEASETASMVLATFGVIGDILRAEPEGFGTFIVSMTHDVSDLLEVLLLSREAGLWVRNDDRWNCPLDIAPLFETVEDLAECQDFMTALFAHPVYREHLASRGHFQELMLGYSDSNKDGGFWMANWALHEAQDRLGRVCRQHGVGFRLFHGRGGTVGRGGGRANRAISAMPSACRNGRIRFTEQGEVISFRYAQPDIAHRHLEQVVSAAIGSLSHGSIEDSIDPSWRTAMEEASAAAMAAYRDLIDDPGFWPWYTGVTPIEQISRLPIASRPVSRKSADEVDFDSLRAIPWVFAWTQARYIVPGWYGTGTGLGAAVASCGLETLQQMYREWPFFSAVMDNVQLEMARARLEIARRYARLAGSRAFHDRIESEFEVARAHVLSISEQKDLLDHSRAVQASIRYRNPHTDPLNLTQLELMRRWRDTDEDDPRRDTLRRLLFLSINGIAAAMQSTG